MKSMIEAKLCWSFILVLAEEEEEEETPFRPFVYNFLSGMRNNWGVGQRECIRFSRPKEARYMAVGNVFAYLGLKTQLCFLCLCPLAYDHTVAPFARAAAEAVTGGKGCIRGQKVR